MRPVRSVVPLRHVYKALLGSYIVHKIVPHKYKIARFMFHYGSSEWYFMHSTELRINFFSEIPKKPCAIFFF